MKAISHSQQSRNSWLLERGKGIGASEAAAVLNCHPHDSAFALAKRKIDIRNGASMPEDNSDDNEALYWGHSLEENIAQRFGELTGCQILCPDNTAIQVHPHNGIMRATLDRLAVVPWTVPSGVPEKYQGCTGILEIKTSQKWESWPDENEPDNLPEHVWIQVQHQMSVTQYEFAFVAVLIHGIRFRWYFVERDNEFITALELAEIAFWQNYVVPGILPPVDGSEATASALKTIRQRTKDIIPLPVGAADRHAALVGIKAKIKALDAEKQELDNWFKGAIGEHRGGFLIDNFGKRVQYTFTDSARDPVLLVPVDAAASLTAAGIKFELKDGGTMRRFNPPRSK